MRPAVFPLQDQPRLLFDTTIHGVDYDKACDLVDAVESVNAPES